MFAPPRFFSEKMSDLKVILNEQLLLKENIY